ncbi:MAG: PDZ domain-containing protein [Lachnospiraceae bacterium]|nr:PDZ domain-containing protein [Lachnospiraceae bacterium]
MFQLPDKDNLKNKPEKRHFINEKIVRPRLTRGQIFKRLLLWGAGAVLFGFLAAVTFAVSEPLAKRYLTEEETEESVSISIPKDEPESITEPETTETSSEAPPETQPIEEMVRAEMARYSFSVEDLVKLHASLTNLSQETDKGIVTVHSMRTQMDWFNNPVETSGLYAGAIIAATPEEYLVLTPIGAVQNADSLEITFPNGARVLGQIKGTDQISHMAVIRIAASELDEDVKKQIKVLELGNSYAVKQGELIFAGGSPAGIVHSVSIGCVSYVAKNVSVVDGVSRLFYTDAKGEAGKGTFLFNTKGQIIGWATDDYKSEGGSMTVVRALSDYKGILEDLSNGHSAPYFGIMGLEVTEAKHQEGLPLGIYVNSAVSDGPAYDAGIQSGDIITRMGENDLVTMKDFQSSLDKLASGDVVTVEVQRYGRDAYMPIEYQVTIGAR